VSAYNFQRQFVEAIRARRKDGRLPKVGERIKLYTGMRTKQCELLREVTVTRVRPIAISSWAMGPMEIVLDGKPLRVNEVQLLAVSDGFADRFAFAEFFRRKHGDSFNGYLIEWDPKS